MWGSRAAKPPDAPTRSCLLLSVAERAQLDALSAALEPSLSAERAAGRDFPEVLDESSLLRFLRAAGHDVSKAADNFKESLLVRERIGANELRRRLHSADLSELWRFERLPFASKVLTSWGEFLPTGTLDRTGDVVLYFNRQLCVSFEQLVATVNRAEYLEFRVAREVQMQMLLFALTIKQGRLVRQTVIVDMHAIPFSELAYHAASPFVKDFRGTFDTKESFLAFPETGARLFVVNAPVVIAPAFNLLRKLLPEDTVKKYSFPGRQYKATLLEAIEEASLPIEYGGTLAMRTPSELVSTHPPSSQPQAPLAARISSASSARDVSPASMREFSDARETQPGDQAAPRRGQRSSVSLLWSWRSKRASNSM